MKKKNHKGDPLGRDQLLKLVGLILDLQLQKRITPKQANVYLIPIHRILVILNKQYKKLKN